MYWWNQRTCHWHSRWQGCNLYLFITILYHKTECTYNLHAFTHLLHQVRNHGPLIVHFTFVFESMLAHLKRMFRGLHEIPDQISTRLGAAKNAGQHIREDAQAKSIAVEFTSRLLILSKFLSLDICLIFLPPFKLLIPCTAFPTETITQTPTRLPRHSRAEKLAREWCNYAYKRNSSSNTVQFKTLHREPSFGKIPVLVKQKSVGYVGVNVLRTLK